MTPDYILTLTNAMTVEKVWDIHVQKMAEFEFDRILYGYTHSLTRNSFGDPNDNLILSNHESAYVNRFIDDKLYYSAPMVRWTIENTGACSWSWIQEQIDRGALSDCERKVLEFNHSMGVTAGYTVSFKSPSVRTRAGMALTARRGLTQQEVDDMWAIHGKEIEAMCNVAHLKLASLPFTGKRRPLTPRQREVLEWVGDGKTTQDIASIMGLTGATVEKHLRLAREALDVETTAQAVLKASFQNQIYTLAGTQGATR